VTRGLKQGADASAALVPAALLFIALAAYLSLVYAAVVLGIGAAAGAGSSNAGLTIAATVIVAVTFARVRGYVQRMLDRFLFGRRATPYEILSQFSDRIAQTYASDDVPALIARTVADGIGTVQAHVWVRFENELRIAGAYPSDGAQDSRRIAVPNVMPEIPGTSYAVPVRHRGELLGAIAVTKRGGEALNTTETRLLDDVASQAGVALRNVALTAELGSHLARISSQARELRASRRRIVETHDAERRRLERDIHDGAQQHLVALAVKARLAATLAQKAPDKTRELVSELRAVTSDALATLRNLGSGIYPPELGENGLVAALEKHAAVSNVAVTIEAPAPRRYSPDVETTVYFVCLEALQNAEKYSGSRNALIRIDHGGGVLRFFVSDDGSGFDAETTPRGSGLDNMADRLATVGGSLEVRSRPGAGTVVAGEIPLAEDGP
jgi:signal transduction histidine kinase